MGSALLRVVVFVGAVLAAALPAHAAGLMFGHDETLHRLVDVDVVGENDEKLSLGYMTSTESLLLPYTLRDDGYVLMPRDTSDTFYTFTDEELAGWQANGAMPDPLPPYEVPMLDRIMGYLLWPTLVVIGLVYLIPGLRRRRAAPADAPPPVA